MLNNYHRDGDFNCSQACEQNQTLFVQDAYTGLSACNKNYVMQTLSYPSAILVQMLSVFQLGEDTKPFFLCKQSQTRGERPLLAQNIYNRWCGPFCKTGCW